MQIQSRKRFHRVNFILTAETFVKEIVQQYFKKHTLNNTKMKILLEKNLILF